MATVAITLNTISVMSPRIIFWDGLDEQSRTVGGGYEQNYGFVLKDYENIRYRYLAIQYIVVAVVMSGLIYTLKDKKPKDDQTISKAIVKMVRDF